MIAIASAPAASASCRTSLDQRRTIDQCEPAAFVRDAECDGPADALRRAGDDGDLAGEASLESSYRLSSMPSPVQMW